MKTYSVIFAQDIPHYGSVDRRNRKDRAGCNGPALTGRSAARPRFLPGPIAAATQPFLASVATSRAGHADRAPKLRHAEVPVRCKPRDHLDGLIRDRLPGWNCRG